jgi:intracellular septation protein
MDARPDPRPVNPILKQVLELGPPLLFFAFYLYVRDDVFTLGGVEYEGFIVAAAVFVPVLLASMGVLWWLTGELSRMQALTAIFVVLFGGLTVWFNDERFFQFKTTLVYGLFAAILGLGLWFRRSYLEWALGQTLKMEHEGWMILTRRMAGMFAVLAAANEFVRLTMSVDAWVKIETFAFPAAMVLFMWVQIMMLQRFLIEDEAPEEQG